MLTCKLAHFLILGLWKQAFRLEIHILLDKDVLQGGDPTRNVKIWSTQ